MSGAMGHALSLLTEGTLSIDAEGRIWRHRSNGKACSPRRAENIGGKGYLRLTLTTGERLETVMAHRVVWTWLRGPIPDGMQINHKDLNKQNNHPDNMEVVSGAENIQHSYANGRRRPWSDSQTWRGRTRLTRDAIEQIRNMRAKGALLREVAQHFDISTTHVQRLCTK